MSKSYSGERIPGTINYHVYVTEGKQKREILIDHSIKIKDKVTDLELTLRNELSYRISLAILIDYTGNISLAESCFRDFKNNTERLLAEDHWLLHSNRIETFLNREETGEEIGDYSFFDPIPEPVTNDLKSISF